MQDRELIVRSQEGDQEAFGLLVRKYQTKVFQMAYGFTRNKETASDLAQEVFIKVYSFLKSFKFRSEFGTWLYRVTVNHIKDHLRKEGRLRTVAFDENIERSTAGANSSPRREGGPGSENLEELIHDAIRSLPPKQRIIVTLRDIQGLPYAEIARTLKISPGTVDSRLHRARKMLRKKLIPYLGGQGEGHEMSQG